MYNYSIDSDGPRACRRGPGFGRMALIAIGVAIAASFIFGALFWVLGLFFHLVGLAIRVAVVTAVVAFVWRRVASRGRRSTVEGPPSGP